MLAAVAKAARLVLAAGSALGCLVVLAVVLQLSCIELVMAAAAAKVASPELVLAAVAKTASTALGCL